eukprot:4573600-Ditylum_brightwellii.AAC.1
METIKLELQSSDKLHSEELATHNINLEKQRSELMSKDGAITLLQSQIGLLQKGKKYHGKTQERMQRDTKIAYTFQKEVADLIKTINNALDTLPTTLDFNPK